MSKARFGLAGLGDQFVDAGGDLLAAVVAELDGAEHFLFGGLLRARFHHHDAVFGAGHDDVQLRFAAFGVGGVGDVFAVHHADAHAAQHMMKGNIGNGQRGARADDGQRVGILLGIGREHHGDDLGFVQEAFGEQRTDGPVDQPAGENFFFRGTSLALDEAARNLAGGVSVFAIINGEREEAGFGFGSSAMQAVTSTTESPERTTTAPLACLAILPVSRVILRPPRSISTVCDISKFSKPRLPDRGRQ